MTTSQSADALICRSAGTPTGRASAAWRPTTAWCAPPQPLSTLCAATDDANANANAQAGFENRGGHLPPAGSAAHALLLALVTYDPAVRISAADALQHAYFSAAPLPSDNALLGPSGERAGPYPRRGVEPLAVGAQRKRKAEEEEKAAAAAAGGGSGVSGAAALHAPPAARAAPARPGALAPGSGSLRRTSAAPPAQQAPPPPPPPRSSSHWD
jgi:hypothetical protein